MTEKVPPTPLITGILTGTATGSTATIVRAGRILTTAAVIRTGGILTTGSTVAAVRGAVHRPFGITPERLPQPVRDHRTRAAAHTGEHHGPHNRG
ncbi:hypothetical protein, partial [Halostreptopolyspora alba]|uniref:hypothetical protein n=1 Tax=Halostreptopolyspora alba TaxID=2487137 RepID=UPI0011CD504E